MADSSPERSHGADDQARDSGDADAINKASDKKNGLVARRADLVECRRETASEDGGSADGDLPRRAGSPIDSLLSVPDDSPSVQGSVLSSPGSSAVLHLRPGLGSPTPSFRPFDRRFQSRIASPSPLSPRPSSPAFLSAHSRNVSLSSTLDAVTAGEAETASPPWEVVRWTKLNKLTGQAFSEAAKRSFGSPTCIAVSAAMVLGTSKGIILMFDYSQNLKAIIGPGTKAVECGAITSIAVSADHTTVAGGHANGSIFTWDTARPAKPFLHIPHLGPSQLANRTADGHVPNAAVTHLGFLGTRRTALVSADDKGMAFAHLATRGTGAFGRVVKTSRILGRYPGAQPPPGKPLKPSTVLAFAPLPLGNVERATDAMGLTAMLTPYLLVIVSTTPVAQTQHKSPRPKEVAPYSTVSGCLAWFPAVRLKVPDPRTGSHTSKVKLAYCWSNVLTVLDVDEMPAETKDKPPTLNFRARSRWRCDEAVVAVQWLSRSVLTVLTATQRLVVLEDQTMRMTDAFDLMHKHVFHADLFSKQLRELVEQQQQQQQQQEYDGDGHENDMNGASGGGGSSVVVADCFTMSFKTYKGRIFLLGFNDVSIGALSNWADRLIALMEHGDYVEAIRLGTSYYTGDADKLTIGLPEDAELRHEMVREKLLEMVAASLKYAFAQRKRDPATADDGHLRELADTCFAACLSVDDVDFLFDDMYEHYEGAGAEGVFLETLEPYILDGSISRVPPAIVKALVAHFVAKGWEARMEEMVCHMDTATLDLDQMTGLCREHGLYDALIYVWNQALRDFITPLMELLALLTPTRNARGYGGGGGGGGGGGSSSSSVGDDNVVNALKMFPYLSYVLTGRVYPTGEVMDAALALQAKSDVYWFLFSGKTITWPKGSSGRKLTTTLDPDQEPPFPYLGVILRFNAPDFLACLNEAFEDGFLNTDAPEKALDQDARAAADEARAFGATLDRQYIVSILGEIMTPANGFGGGDTVYLDMFIARNVAKYPQYLLLPGSTLNKVLRGLCNYPGPDLADDAQLSVEYLLSVYQPPDLASTLVPLLRAAGFFRVLKRTYKTEQQYGSLIASYFEDPEDRPAVFDCISECLARRGLTRRQLQDVLAVIKDKASDLVHLDPSRAARTIEAGARDLHPDMLQAVDDEPELQFRYLQTILEPGLSPGDEDKASGNTTTAEAAAAAAAAATAAVSKADKDLVQRYVSLMCRFDPGHVSDYIDLVRATADLRLESLLPTMEEAGVIDAAVVLMAHDGHVSEAMARLTSHLGTLESALLGLVSRQDGPQQGADDLVEALHKYVHVGIWLCQRQTRAAGARRTVAKEARNQHGRGDGDLSPTERLWLDLINATVQVTRSVSAAAAADTAAEDHAAKTNGDGPVVADRQRQRDENSSKGRERVVQGLRLLVQNIFTALLTATSTSPSSSSSSSGSNSSSSSGSRITTNTTTTITTATTTNTTTTTNAAAATLAAAATTTTTAPSSPVATTSRPAAMAGSNMSFLRILRAFLAQAAATSPSLADLRAVLATIFSAYAYEESILRLANRLLERSLFVSVSRAVQLRQRGWRPRGSTCEACGKRVTGPGVAGDRLLEAWEARELRDRDRPRRLAAQHAPTAAAAAAAASPPDAQPDAKGKGKAPDRDARSRADFQVRGDPDPDPDPDPHQDALARAVAGVMAAETSAPAPRADAVVAAGKKRDEPLGPLVVLACRHIYHQRCLDELQDAASRRGGGGRGPRYKCPIDS